MHQSPQEPLPWARQGEHSAEAPRCRQRQGILVVVGGGGGGPGGHLRLDAGQPAGEQGSSIGGGGRGRVTLEFRESVYVQPMQAMQSKGCSWLEGAPPVPSMLPLAMCRAEGYKCGGVKKCGLHLTSP